jgi:hypothetical protein
MKKQYPTPQQNHDEAVAKFRSLVNEICKMTDAISDAAEGHFDIDFNEVHWGHVGDAEETRNALKAILDRVRGEGEYARN